MHRQDRCDRKAAASRDICRFLQSTELDIANEQYPAGISGAFQLLQNFDVLLIWHSHLNNDYVGAPMIHDVSKVQGMA